MVTNKLLCCVKATISERLKEYISVLKNIYIVFQYFSNCSQPKGHVGDG